MSNFLESDSNLLEKNLKIVKNEFEDEMEELFGGVGQKPLSGAAAGEQIAPPREYKVVTPTGGFCVKCFKLNTNEKFFLNLCQTDGIPPPEDITETELRNILQSDVPSSYRIPMSISQPRLTKDKSDNQVDVCDVAINIEFFQKCEQSAFFRDFLIALVLEALSEKYNIQVKVDNWIILKNRKFIGKLVTHRIQNRDVKKVYESFKNLSEEEKKSMEKLSQGVDGGKKLIQEIDSNEINLLKNSAANPLNLAKIKEGISLAQSTIPQYKLIAKYNGEVVDEILAEFYLPKCVSLKEISLDIGEDRICMESMKRGYIFDKFVDFSLDQEKASARFNRTNRMLQVRLPVISAN